MRNPMRSQKGQLQLLSIMAVATAGSFLVIQQAKMFSVIQAHAKRLDQNYAANNFHDEIKKLLSKDGACTRTLLNKNGNRTGSSFTELNSFRMANGNTALSINDTYQTGALTLSSIHYQKYLASPGDPQKGSAEIEVRFTRNGGNFDGREIIRTIPVDVELNNSNKVVLCNDEGPVQAPPPPFQILESPTHSGTPILNSNMSNKTCNDNGFAKGVTLEVRQAATWTAWTSTGGWTSGSGGSVIDKLLCYNP